MSHLVSAKQQDRKSDKISLCDLLPHRFAYDKIRCALYCPRPLKIKKSANPDRREGKKFVVLSKTTVETGAGGIICMCEEPVQN